MPLRSSLTRWKRGFSALERWRLCCWAWAAGWYWLRHWGTRSKAVRLWSSDDSSKMVDVLFNDITLYFTGFRRAEVTVLHDGVKLKHWGRWFVLIWCSGVSQRLEDGTTIRSPGRVRPLIVFTPSASSASSPLGRSATWLSGWPLLCHSAASTTPVSFCRVQVVLASECSHPQYHYVWERVSSKFQRDLNVHYRCINRIKNSMWPYIVNT